MSLLKDKQIVYQTETIVKEENRVHFSIDEVLEPGTYILEIVVDDQYIFPSDTDEKLYLVSSSKNIQEEIAGTYGIEQLKQEIEESCQSLIAEKQEVYSSTDEEIAKMKDELEGFKSVLSQLNQTVKVYPEGSNQLIEEQVPKNGIVTKITSGLTRSFVLPNNSSLGFILLEFRSSSSNLVQQIILSNRKFKTGLPTKLVIPLVDENNTLYLLKIELLTQMSRSSNESEITYQVTFSNEVPFDLSVFTAYMFSKPIL